MSEDKEALAARLNSLKPGKPKTSGVNMLAVVGMTALAGVGLGAAGVAFWPEAEQPVDAIATSEGTEFPTGSGMEGFRVTDKGDAAQTQTAPVMRSVSSRKEDELADQLAKAKAELDALKSASPEDTTALQAGQAKASMIPKPQLRLKQQRSGQKSYRGSVQKKKPSPPRKSIRT
jgi:hypothetical protein